MNIETIKKKTEEINKIKQSPIDELKPTFKQLFVPIFDKYPEVLSFRWTQYTPYFNDGDPCVFEVHGLEVEIDGVEQYGESYVELDYPGDSIEDKKLESELKELLENFWSIPKDIMQELFGDHAEIIVNRNGIDVEEYEHD